MALFNQTFVRTGQLLAWYSCGVRRLFTRTISYYSQFREQVATTYTRCVHIPPKPVQFESTSNIISRNISLSAALNSGKHKHWMHQPRKLEIHVPENNFEPQPELTEEEINSIVTEILASVGSKDVMVQTVARQTVREKVEDLLLKGWEPDMIKGVFVMHTAFLTKSKSKMNDIVDNLCAFGFTNIQAATLLASGIVTDFSQKRLMESLDTLRKSGMKDGQLQVIVARFPELLTYDSKSINNRVDSLKALFKTDDIVPLIVKAPNILSDDWSTIFESFHYVFSTMGVKQRQMVNSKLFRYPLHFVKIRHTFVSRTGHYVKPRRDEDPVRMTNPHLKDIIDTSDENFAKKYGNMTLKDYKAFAAMIMKEIENEKEMHDSDMDDSDEDIDEMDDENFDMKSDS